MACQKVTSILLFLTTGSVGKNIPVFYSTSNSGVLDNGDRHFGPKYWNKVSQDFYVKEDFNWEGKIAPAADVNKNRCEWRDSRRDRKQSPILLESDFPCADRHHAYPQDNRCFPADIDFKVTRRSLRAEFNRCAVRPTIDFSYSPNHWHLHYVEVVAPGEHKIRRDGKTMEFVAEVIMGHVGSNNNKDDLLNLSVLYNVGTECNLQLKPYLLEFAENMVSEYKTCGLEGYEWWTDNICQLRDRFNGECNLNQGLCSSCCRRRLDDSDGGDDGGRVLRGRSLAGCDGIDCRRCCNRQLHAESMSPAAGAEEETMDMSSLTGIQGLMQQLEAVQMLQEPERNVTGKLDGEDLDELLTYLGGDKESRRLEEFLVNPYALYKFAEERDDKYYKYEGSQTFPPCFDNTHYRVMRKPRHICAFQLKMIERMIAGKITRGSDGKCHLATVGRMRDHQRCMVDTNRPIQYYEMGKKERNMQLKDCVEWS